jgi:hypothetical protein
VCQSTVIAYEVNVLKERRLTERSNKDARIPIGKREADILIQSAANLVRGRTDLPVLECAAGRPLISTMLFVVERLWHSESGSQTGVL